MSIEWKYVKKPVLWKDGNHWLPKHFEAVTTSQEAICFTCQTIFKDKDQAYLFDGGGILTVLKKKAKDISKLRTRHLVLHNVNLFCHNCLIPKMVYHKVVVRLV